MATKNLGQVSGVYIGNTPPDNIIMIWYDNTPGLMVHKVYDTNIKQWVVLDKNIISIVTYSALVNLAASPGLSVGTWFNISDKGILALAITSTKVQYVDALGNILIDDLGNNIQYHVTSSNLLIDDISGVFDLVNNKLVFQFSEQTPNYIADDYILGKAIRNNVWSLVKYKLSSFLSKATGNSITWNGGLFFNFGDAIKNVLNKAGGVVAKDSYDTDQEALYIAINNVGKENQTIIQNANKAISDSTTDSAIYSKTLQSDLVTGGATIDAAKGDSLFTIISKFQKWINQFKWATGIRISSTFTQATSQQYINSNDTVETAFSKIQFWLKNMYISLSLSSAFSPYPYSGTIADLAPNDTLEEAFKKVQGKLNQIGNLSDGQIQSKAIVNNTSVPVTTLDLKNGKASFYDINDVNQICQIDASIPSIKVINNSNNKFSQITKDGISSNAANQNLYPVSSNIVNAASVVGLGYGNIAKDTSLNTAFLAGVAGVASNSNPNPAPSYGGYFDKLMVNGLYLNIKSIYSDYIMTMTDVCLSCYNTSNTTIHISLILYPYNGQNIYITQMYANNIIIDAGSSNKISYNGTIASSITTDSTNKTNTFRLIWDGQYWILNKLNW
jgi:hypothetical protein